MIGSLIGAGISVAGSIFGGLKASEAMQEAKKNIETRKKENQAWYDRRYNEDVTQRADAQRILTKTGEEIKNRNREVAGMQAVTGGSTESVIAAKAANNQALAEATSRIAAAGDARKDRIEETYLKNKAGYDDALANMEVNRAHAITQAIGGVSKAGADIAGIDWSGSSDKRALKENYDKEYD